MFEEKPHEGGERRRGHSNGSEAEFVENSVKIPKDNVGENRSEAHLSERDQKTTCYRPLRIPSMFFNLPLKHETTYEPITHIFWKTACLITKIYLTTRSQLTPLEQPCARALWTLKFLVFASSPSFRPTEQLERATRHPGLATAHNGIDFYCGNRGKARGLRNGLWGKQLYPNLTS